MDPITATLWYLGAIGLGFVLARVNWQRLCRQRRADAPLEDKFPLVQPP